MNARGASIPVHAVTAPPAAQSSDPSVSKSELVARIPSPALDPDVRETPVGSDAVVKLLQSENERLRVELQRMLTERDLFQSQCQDQLAVQFIQEYSDRLAKEDISLVLGQVIDALKAIPSDDQITDFLAGHKAFMREKHDADGKWFAIKGDRNHPDAQSIADLRRTVGEVWKFELERIFGIEGARQIIEKP